MTADDLISALGLCPHPEGGHFRETYRHRATEGSDTIAEQRGAGTAIYFLLRAGEHSAWHRVDADEMWHFYAGAPLCLRTWDGRGEVKENILGPAVQKGQHPQLLVPAGQFQTAHTLGEFTLTGATVTPAFLFSGFELAAPGWEPPV